MAAQITHAAGESIVSELPPGTNAVVLAAKDETELILVAKKLQISGIKHAVIREIDPPYDGQITAIGIVPLLDRKPLKPILSTLPLLGKKLSPGERKETSSLVKSQPGATCAFGETTSQKE